MNQSKAKILLFLKEFPGVLRNSQEEFLGPCIISHLIQSYTEHATHRMFLECLFA